MTSSVTLRPVAFKPMPQVISGTWVLTVIAFVDGRCLVGLKLGPYLGRPTPVLTFLNLFPWTVVKPLWRGVEVDPLHRKIGI